MKDQWDLFMAMLKDIGWFFTRLYLEDGCSLSTLDDGADQTVPACNGFNSAVNVEKVPFKNEECSWVFSGN